MKRVIKGKHICCFIGNRSINETANLKKELSEIVENLITCEKTDVFLFGSKSQFNSLCYETVTELKKKYSHIKRIYVRAEYPYINEDYKKYLLQSYEDTYYPERITDAGKAVYVERNFEMIQSSDICIIFYEEKFAPTGRKSGAKIALEYAEKQKKQVIKLPNVE